MSTVNVLVQKDTGFILDLVCKKSETILKLSRVPMIGEEVFIDGRRHKVTDVWHHERKYQLFSNEIDATVWVE